MRINIKAFPRSFWFLLFVCLCLAFEQCRADDANQSAAVSHPEGIVAKCFDGDTIKLADRRVVRLAGIDAPELSHKGSPAQYYSRRARQALEDLARGKKIQLAAVGSLPKDRYGRLVADARLENGQSLSEGMVEQGAAFFYPHENLDQEYMNRLLDLQRDAIRERRGMWEHLLSLPIAKNHYVGNKNSMRFFPASCPSASKIKPRNRVEFGTLMDAFLAGYAPARICIFWPNAQ